MPGPSRHAVPARSDGADATRPVLELTFRGHRRDIRCAAFQPTRQCHQQREEGSSVLPPRLVTGGADGAVMLWDSRPTNRALRFVGHRGPVLGCDYCPASVAGASVTLFASCGMDGYVRLWVPNVRRTTTGHPSSVLLHRGREPHNHNSTAVSNTSASGDSNGAAWRVHTGAARAVKFAQDGSSHLYTCGDDKSVKAWDLNYAASASSYPSGEPLVTFRGSRFLGNFNASGSGGGGINSGARVLRNATSHNNWVRCLAVQGPAATSGGGGNRYVVSGGDDNAVMVWDVRSPHAGPAHAFFEHRGAVKGLAFHGNGNLLAACDASGAINIFDLRKSSGQEQQQQHRSSSSSPSSRYGLVQHYADAHGPGGVAVNSIAFGPSAHGTSGGWLLSAGDDGTAKLWDTAEGFLHCTVQAHEGAVRSVAFSDDGAHFVTAGTDGVAMVWRLGLTAQRHRQQHCPAAAPPPPPHAPAHRHDHQHHQQFGNPPVLASAASMREIQNYNYLDGDDGEMEEEEQQEEGEEEQQQGQGSHGIGNTSNSNGYYGGRARAPLPQRQQRDAGRKARVPAPWVSDPRPAATSDSSGAAAVDPGYLEWQRRCLGATSQRVGSSSTDGDGGGASAPSGGSPTPKPTAGSSGRPPLPPSASTSPSRPATAPAHGVNAVPFIIDDSYTQYVEVSIAAAPAHTSNHATTTTTTTTTATTTSASPPRERSFERSEERYSYIATPQREAEVQRRLRQGRHQPKEAEAQLGLVRSTLADNNDADHNDNDDGIAEQQQLVRRERQQQQQQVALSGRRLENVESAVAALVEYVQGENAQRDGELAGLRADGERRHARQREEMVALKGLMEQLIQQQQALLGRLGIDSQQQQQQEQQQHHTGEDEEKEEEE